MGAARPRAEEHALRPEGGPSPRLAKLSAPLG